MYVCAHIRTYERNNKCVVVESASEKNILVRRDACYRSSIYIAFV